MNSSNINQITIGELNSINDPYSVGNIDGFNFIACAIQSELVILSEDFKQIQTIENSGKLTALSSCSESGKIAICSHRNVQLFEPRFQNNGQIFPYKWIETQRWTMSNNIDAIHWVLDGLRLLIYADKDLFLYQHKTLSCVVNSSRPVSQNGKVKFTLNSMEDETVWEVIWTIKLANKIKNLRFSHDGTLFATCGEQDPFIKIWYQLKDSQSFSFIYVQHPAPVCGFEWRRSGGHLMPRRLVHNALITWCEDNTARIWKEIPSNEPNPELHFINAVQNAIALEHEKENFNKPKKQYNAHKIAFQMRKAKGRLVHKLTHIINEKKKLNIVDPNHAATIQSIGGAIPDMIRSSTFADFSIPAYTPGDTLVFCLAATINAENDCFLVPSMSASNSPDGKTNKTRKGTRPRPFTVHWLNNKEYEFECGTQRILAETATFMAEKHDSKEVSPCQMMHSLHSSTSSAGIAAELTLPGPHHLPHPITAPNLTAKEAKAAEPFIENASTKDFIDYKLEKLLRQWSKSCDILFTIHPLDGSLLTWTLEWLDDPWKQPIVSFASRIPEAFPLGDALSLSLRVNTMRPSMLLYDHSNNGNIKHDGEEATQQSSQELQICVARSKFMVENNEIYLLTEHGTGTLNSWRLQVENGSAESGHPKAISTQHQQSLSSAMSVVNVIHGFRMGRPSTDPTALEILKSEGLFDSTALTSAQLLPQYHPVQLVGMLNAGKIQRVRAILLNVLRAVRYRQAGGSFSISIVRPPLGRSGGSASTKRKIDLDFDADPQQYSQRRNSISAMSPLDISDLEYDELEAITPLPLYSLLAADSVSDKDTGGGGVGGDTNRDQNKTATKNDEESNVYESLFAQNFVEDELNIDDDFELNDDSTYEGRKSSFSRSRKLSIGSVNDPSMLASSNPNAPPPTKFTAKHSRVLTEMLTHTHLHGLTSVDQMHLLAVADTISHFSNSVVDRLAQANAALQPAVMSSMGDSSASGYASAAGGMETVDECGLRFLMAKKQHEYLLRCLPLKQRRQLKAMGISTACVIWAFHSDTETELMNSIPCFQRQQENWDELRSYGIAWWMRNNATLRICIERVAKNAFQRDQNPLDAALFYLAMRKKNVLTQLFKTVNDTRMYEFFREDFTEERWKKAALKNAFILMSKQRFQHAAAFFLLGGSIKDALQTILTRLHDLQLAIVVLRLYEIDPEAQMELLTELFCREVLNCEPEYIRNNSNGEKITFPNSERNPFERSMSLWIMKEYVLSAETLLEETSSASRENLANGITGETAGAGENKTLGEPFLPDIFNFYSFLRRHPLVIRQKLARSGITTTTTEQFLTWVRQIGANVNEAEKRLFLKTANAHLDAGCPLLALDVLSSLPEQLEPMEQPLENIPKKEENTQKPVEEVDWSAPVTQLKEDKLELTWSDDEEEEDGEPKESKVGGISNAKDEKLASTVPATIKKCPPEFQQLKLLSTLSIMTDELNTLASGGYEVAGGQLRLELFCWLEKECEVLRRICYPNEKEDELNDEAMMTATDEASTIVDEQFGSSSSTREIPPLHEALQQDRLELHERVRQIQRRRNWLKKHRELLHSLAAYCAANGSKNVRLISIQMELLLLLLEEQRNEKDELQHINEPIPDIHSFPLLVSSLSSNVNSPISPLRFITDQCASLLSAINEFERIPQIDTDVPKVTKLFNVCQGLSFCIYQSLSNIENLTAQSARFNGPLTQKIRRPSVTAASLPDNDELQVHSQPNHWPGVNSLIALLSREHILHQQEEAPPPNLRLLLVEFFVSIFVSMFFYAFALYDARLLFRLSAHSFDARMFGEVFGGGGERRLRSAVPVRPPPPKTEPKQDKNTSQQEQDELAAMRAKLHAKVFTTIAVKSASSQKLHPALQQPAQGSSEQVIQCWISPRKHIVQYFSEKVPLDQTGVTANSADFYDSDLESPEEKEEPSNDDSDYFKFQDDYGDEPKTKVLPHDCPNGYAWTLIRLALLRQMCIKLERFIEMAGFDFREVARTFPKLEQVIRRLNFWSTELVDKLESEPDGCPSNFLPNMHVQDLPGEFDAHQLQSAQISPLLRKYHILIEPGNTPFEYDEHGVKPVRRLWTQLVRQEELVPVFVRFIFGKNQLSKSKTTGSFMDASAAADGRSGNILSVIKLIHREHDPIVAFAINSARSGQIVLSTGRELQELSIDTVLNERERICTRAGQFPSTSSFLLGQNRPELDIQIQQQIQNSIHNNDDYQLLLPGTDAATGTSTSGSSTATGPGGRNVHLSSANLRKRPISGIRRLEAHGTLPYYVSGSSDGSIFLWEWGVEQPIFIARVAGQFAKIVKLAFAQNGSRFAAVDGDGLLCLWQAQPGMPSRRPYFSQKCHNKFVTDVKYVGQTSTLVATAGHSTGDQNLLLWDTIMPQTKAIVHTFVGHPDGAQCLAYEPKSQSIISGGKHGEICIWDVRQRQLRHTLKAFDSASSSVKCICLDPNADIIAAGSNEGDIKIWSAISPVPQLLYSLPTEHVSRSGFSLRQVASISLQGVQQVHIDQRQHLYSCGADNSLKIRAIPSLL